MKKKYCTENISVQDIILIEQKLYELYQNAICKFEKSFSFYKCKIELIECWTKDDQNISTMIRPTLDHKYIYWIGYQILYKGNPIIYDDENSTLERSYSILRITKKLKRNKSKVFVEIFDNTEDVTEELLEDLDKVKKIFKTGERR